ncbi:MAG: hypothetical protein US07_C0021G0001 [Candidatus Levybacteria bacterium GW2011_GWB1_36_18]|nr:MAG: hypothetical protein US07_C0021G0001 [Candidatus Levybacteria bacterium GW2011_GWB1_36_18]
MKLPIGNFFEKKTDSEYFLTLTLRNERATAVVFEKTSGRVKVVGKGEKEFKRTIEEEDEEDLLKALDVAISDAESSLPDNVESHKTIFGIKGNWVEEGKIKKEYLGKLKKISDSLDLKPMGFLVVTEAISHLLQKEEGAPVSAILCEVGKNALTVSLLKAGKILEEKTSEVHENKPFTVDALLKHFEAPEVLPSRIIIFGSNEDLTQEFLGFTWSKSLPFLHPPQITSLPLDFDAQAVLFGAVSQMGLSVVMDTLDKTFKEGDSLAKALEEEKLKEPVEKVSEAMSSDYFGFKEGADISKEMPKKVPEVPAESPLTAVEDTAEIPEGIKEEKTGRAELPEKAGFLLLGARQTLGKVFAYTKTMKRKPALIGIGAVILLVFLLFIYLFATSATLTLGVSAKESAKSEKITFTKGSTDVSNNEISGKFVTDTQDGKSTIDTTGKKETGDKAKGTVTIFNSADSPRTFTEGTAITSSNNLEFTLDKSVTVASGSSDPINPKSGQANVTVTASKFGTSYNLPSGTKFTIGELSTVAAKNDDAFSGGTTKNVSVVAKADIDKLTKQLTSDLEKKAREELSKQVTSDSVLLPVFSSEDFSKKSFSKDADDEAQQVSLTAEIEFTGIIYSKKDLISFAKDSFQKELGPNLVIDEKNLSLDVKDFEKTDDGVSGIMEITAILLPKIDEKSLASEIAGKSLSDAQRRLEGLPKVETVEIRISPSIPFLPKRLPISSGKIKFIIEKNG